MHLMLVKKAMSREALQKYILKNIRDEREIIGKGRVRENNNWQQRQAGSEKNHLWLKSKFISFMVS